jgi:hypothetical protein
MNAKCLFRHPSAGWGPLHLSIERGVSRIGGIDPSLRWGDGNVFGEAQYSTKISASLRLCVNPSDYHSRKSRGPWPGLSEIRFARRHEGTKRLLRVFVSLCELKAWPNFVHAETRRRGGMTLRTLREITWFTQSSQRSQRVIECAARRSHFLHASAPPREQISFDGNSL